VRQRKLAVLSAAAVLLLLFFLASSPRELARRAEFLAGSASTDLAVRRANGSGTAFDRSYFVFVESIRRRLPGNIRGVAIFTPHPTTEALYLAAYELAPVPVLLAPARVPPRWLAAAYRVPPPDGWRIVARVPGGSLSAPP
jgi:hypothetical protein